MPYEPVDHDPGYGSAFLVVLLLCAIAISIALIMSAAERRDKNQVPSKTSPAERRRIDAPGPRSGWYQVEACKKNTPVFLS